MKLFRLKVLCRGLFLRMFGEDDSAGFGCVSDK